MSDRKARSQGRGTGALVSPSDVAAALGSFTENSPLAMAATDGDDHVVRYANAAFCRLAALAPDAIIGRPIAETMAASHPSTVALLSRVHETRRAAGAVGVGREPIEEGAALWTYSAWPIQSEGRQMTGLLVQESTPTREAPGRGGTADGAEQMRDANFALLVAGIEAQEEAEAQTASATTLRQLAAAVEASERRYRNRAAELQATIDGIEDGVAVVNAAGDVIVANGALVRALGHPVATGTELGTALGGADLRARAEPTLLQSKNDKRWLEIRTFETHPDDGDGAGASSRVVMIRDVTEDRLAETAREAFIGVLSHELRTPITTILGMSRILYQSVERDGRAQRELIKDVAEESERLYRLVEDLLVLSRSERGRMKVESEPVLIQHAIHDAIAAEAGRFPLVRFTSKVGRLPPVSADPTYVRQILANLLNNAGKYGPDGPSEVQVVAMQSGDEVLVRVLDEGAGFPAGEGERLFELFYRSGDSFPRRTGSGIGLYVTRTLAEAMGGRAWAKLRDPRGAEFGFAVPVTTDDDV